MQLPGTAALQALQANDVEALRVVHGVCSAVGFCSSGALLLLLELEYTRVVFVLLKCLVCGVYRVVSFHGGCWLKVTWHVLCWGGMSVEGMWKCEDTESVPCSGWVLWCRKEMRRGCP